MSRKIGSDAPREHLPGDKPRRRNSRQQRIARRPLRIARWDQLVGGAGDGKTIKGIVADLLADGYSTRKIADFITDDYGIEPPMTRETARHLIHDLAEHLGMIVPVDHPIQVRAKAVKMGERPPATNTAKRRPLGRRAS